MSKKDVSNVTRFAAPGFSSKSTDFEKTVFNPGGIGTGDTVDETGHKQVMEHFEPAEADSSETAAAGLLAPEDEARSFATRGQSDNRYRAGSLSRSGNEADKLGSGVKRRLASRELLG
jgi:hypothetical protein